MRGQLRVVFKQYPLSFHTNARNAAIASLAAHRQGKFWKYHDLLFQNMKRLSRKELVDWAKVAGLDVPRFEKDMGDPQLQAQVSQDMAEGVRAGVRGTPAMYLNGRKIKTSPSTVEDVVRLVKSEVLKSE